MDDAVARFRAASEAFDIGEMMSLLAPDAELVSPISGRMVFRGHDDLRILLAAVYGSFSSLKWTEDVGGGSVRVVLGQATVGRLRLTDAMVFDLADDGSIQRLRPQLRPWLPLTVLALKLGPKIARHPAIVRRALRRA